MGKTIRLTESDLVRLVKKVIKEQSTNSGNNLVSNFIQTMDNNFNAEKFGNYGFNQLPQYVTNVAKNVPIIKDGKRTTSQGLQLYRMKSKTSSEPFVYLWLDSRNISSKPTIHIFAFGRDNSYDLSSQFDDFKEWLINNTSPKIYR